MDNRVQIVIDAQDNASAVLNQVGGNVSDFQSRMEAMRTSAFVALGALTAFTAGVVALGVSAVSQAANMEQLRISFTTMLGSAKEADSFMRDLVKFAKDTPFTLQGLQVAAKQLLAYGVTQKDVLTDLTSLGNIAAGVGMDKLPNLILAFGQVRAAGRLTGMELRQFTEAGVPLLEELSKVTGMSVQEMAGNIGDLKIPFDTVNQALKNLSGEGGRFNNLMGNQMQSLSGKISNLQDSWQLLLAKAGQPFLHVLGQLVDILTNSVMPAISRLIDFFERHKTMTEVLAIVIGTLLVAAFAGLTTILVVSAIPAFLALAAFMAPFMIGGLIVGAIVAGIFLLVQNWSMLKEHIVGIWTSIKDFFIGIWEDIKGVFKGAYDYILNLIQPILNLINSVKSAASSIGGGVTAAFNSTKGLLHFASGGVVPGGLGMPQLAVVHGGETVIPSSGLRGPSGSGGFGSVIININADVIAGDNGIRMLADKVGNVVMQSLRNNVKL